MNLPPFNFRPIFPDFILNKSSNLFRSNAVDDGDEKSVKWLTESMGIKSYVDLREETEFCSTSKLDEYYVRKLPDEMMANNYRFDSSSQRYRYHVDIFAYFDTRKTLTMNAGEFYCFLLDNSQPCFKHVFSLLAIEENYPIVITCGYGKDRTGIVAALLMQLCGYSDDQIIDEYTKSDECLLPLRKKLDEIILAEGLHEDFVRCPKEAMERFLLHLQNKYGGPVAYLKLSGITDQQIENIKRILTGQYNET